MDRISVVIPCYNLGRYLPATLKSVLAQTHPVFEVIVVDDGSSDDSAAIAESFGAPVRVIRQKNARVSAARNRGMDAATGDYVALLDGDDVWAPEKIERQLAYLHAHPEVGAVGCNLAVVEDDGKVSSETRDQENGDPGRPAVEYFGAPRMPQICSTVLLRRAIADAVRFPVDVADAEDIIFGACVRQCTRIGMVPEVLVYYRRHPGQYTQLPQVLSKGIRARLAWSRQHYAQVGAGSYDEAKRAVLNGAVELVMHRYWQRNLPAFRALRQELLSIWPSDEPKPKVLTRWYLPTALLKLKDRLEGLTAGPGGPKLDQSRSKFAAKDQRLAE